MTDDIERIRKALSTAMHQDTPYAEAVAAFSAAKRMSCAKGFKSLDDVLAAIGPAKNAADSFFSKGDSWKNEPYGWNQVVPFGKHSGEELGEIAKSDPEYIVWLHGQELRSTQLRRAVESVHEWLEQQSGEG